MSLRSENRECALRNHIQSFAIVNDVGYIDIKLFLNDAFSEFNRSVNDIIEVHNMIKIQGVLSVLFERYDSKTDTTISTNFFGVTKFQLVDKDTDLHLWYSEKLINTISQNIEKFESEGSGWKLSSIIELKVNACKYVGFRGSSYIDLPKWVKSKHAVINVKNYDNECFKWAILSKFRYDSGLTKDCQRISNYNDLHFINELGVHIDFENVQFPMDVLKILKFEELNDFLSINVYVLENDNDESNNISPLRLTKCVKRYHVNLLLLYKEECVNGEMKTKSHYCWISNFSALMHNLLSKRNGRLYICNRCLHYFSSSEKLDVHTDSCMKQNKCAILLPSEDEKFIKFENFKNQLRVPFCIYADIESILKPMNQNNTVFSNQSNTKAYQEHIPCSVGYYFKSDLPSIQCRYSKNRSPNCVKWFCDELYKIYEEVKPVFDTIQPMNLSDTEEMLFNSTIMCHICATNFSAADVKVKDHCHLSGQYRGAAHDFCNLKYQTSRIIPVIFHNLSGYDCHLLIKDIVSQFDGDVSVIPLNTENYISFTKVVQDSVKRDDDDSRRNIIKFKFLDSYRFLSSSLDSLASYLPSSEKTILRTAEWPAHITLEDLKLLERKGVKIIIII